MLAADVMMKPLAEHGYVQRVLAGWTGPEYEFNAVFPRGMTQSPKVRAFIDFLVERLNFEANYMEELCPIFKRQHEQAMATAEGKTKKKHGEVVEAVADGEQELEEETATA